MPRKCREKLSASTNGTAQAAAGPLGHEARDRVWRGTSRGSRRLSGGSASSWIQEDLGGRSSASPQHQARESSASWLDQGLGNGLGAAIPSPRITPREFCAAKQTNHISCQGAQAFWQVGDGAQELTCLAAVYS